MRCTACNVENAPNATACEKCGASLTRRSRRRGGGEQIDSPFGPIGNGPNRRALVAYRCAVIGLIPLVGLVAGPIAVALAWRAWVRDRKDAGFSARGPLNGALLLGALTTLTNGIGLMLMILGL